MIDTVHLERTFLFWEDAVNYAVKHKFWGKVTVVLKEDKLYHYEMKEGK